MNVKSLSHVQLFTTPWTTAYQAPPSRGFSRQEYWSGLPLPSPITLYSLLNFGKKENCTIYAFIRGAGRKLDFMLFADRNVEESLKLCWGLLSISF